jgi:hypothetical protein
MQFMKPESFNSNITGCNPVLKGGKRFRSLKGFNSSITG